MNENFSLEFIIFRGELSKKQKDIYDKLIWSSDDFKLILSNLEINNIKLLDRYEPSISSLDEKKQLRLDISGPTRSDYRIIFTQEHSSSKEYFSIDELKIISKKIKDELVEYLGYDFYDPILFLEIH